MATKFISLSHHRQYTLLPPARRTLCDQVCLSFCLSVCLCVCLSVCSLTQKVMHGFSISRYFILEVIWVDLRYHLEVTVARQCHFGAKSTVAQTERFRPKLLQNTNRKSHVFCLLAPSSMTLEPRFRSNQETIL